MKLATFLSWTLHALRRAQLAAAGGVFTGAFLLTSLLGIPLESLSQRLTGG